MNKPNFKVTVCLSPGQKYKLLVHHRLYLSNDHTIGETNTFSHKKMISSLYLEHSFLLLGNYQQYSFQASQPQKSQHCSCRYIYQWSTPQWWYVTSYLDQLITTVYTCIIILLYWWYVSRQAKRDLLCVKIEKCVFAYVNSFIFLELEHVWYMALRQL